MAQFYPLRTTQIESTDYIIRILGTGAANPTKQEGEGVVVTYRGSAGAYRIQFAENPYQFIGAFATFLGTTPAGLGGWSVVFVDYDATNFRLDFVVFNAANAAADLAATQRISIIAKFARSGV
jgi:hypothetical protein